MYAIVEIKGKQFKVQEQDTLYVPKLKDADVDDTVTFDRILLVGGDDIQVGAPTVNGALMQAKVLGHVKADKVLVFKKKRRKRYKVTRGHRQQYTQLQVESLSLNGKNDNGKTEENSEQEAEENGN
jgi:large subunit ribosomal protein L21